MKVLRKFSLNGINVVLRYPQRRDWFDLMVNFNAMVKERAFISSDKKQSRAEAKKWLYGCIAAIARKEAVAVVAEVNRNIVGMADIHKRVEPRMAHIGDFGITVAKEFRGKGFGKKLLRAVVSEARKVLRLRIVALTCSEPNTNALNLYKKCGFEKIGVVKKGRRHHGRYINHVLMVKYLRK